MRRNASKPARVKRAKGRRPGGSTISIKSRSSSVRIAVRSSPGLALAGAARPAVQPEAVVERIGLSAARPKLRADQVALGGGERGRVGGLRVGGRGHGGALSGNRSRHFERPARERNGFFGVGAFRPSV